MRFIGLIVVVAIIYLAMSRHATQSSASSPEVKEAISIIDSSLPPKPGATPAPAKAGGPAQSDYRAAMDRARSVVDVVKHQQAEGTGF